MTFTEIVAEVCDRLNLTSTDAFTRVGGFVNRRYKEVVSSIGLQTSKRTSVTVSLDPDVDLDLPDVAIQQIEKVIKIQIDFGTDGLKRLDERTYEDITSRQTIRAAPRAFGVKRMDSQQTIITLDGYPEEDFELLVYGYELSDLLSGTIEPAFPEDFHDVLVEGAMSDELRKMEKYNEASFSQSKFDQRLSALRLFISISAYKDLYQGKNRQSPTWYNVMGRYGTD